MDQNALPPDPIQSSACPAQSCLCHHAARDFGNTLPVGRVERNHLALHPTKASLVRKCSAICIDHAHLCRLESSVQEPFAPEMLVQAVTQPLACSSRHLQASLFHPHLHLTCPVNWKFFKLSHMQIFWASKHHSSLHLSEGKAARRRVCPCGKTTSNKNSRKALCFSRTLRQAHLHHVATQCGRVPIQASLLVVYTSSELACYQFSCLSFSVRSSHAQSCFDFCKCCASATMLKAMLSVSAITVLLGWCLSRR